MSRTASPRRAVAYLLATVLAAVLAAAAPSYGEPGDEAIPQNLIQNLEAAATGYLKAEAAHEASVKRQALLRKQLLSVEVQLAPLREEVVRVATAQYQNGRLDSFGALLGSHDADQFWERATLLQELTYIKNQAIARLSAVEAQVAREKAAIDAEAAKQAELSKEMKLRMKAAEKAILAAGGGRPTGYLSPDSPAAIPAPRRADGSWPTERCSVKDPTNTGGCVTPRLLHAYEQARSAGFTRYTKCWRWQSWGEHPKGRACDFSSTVGGFNGVATGGDRTYGNRLAGYFVKNARALGVMYVIWFKMIWFPGLGWRSYSGCCGPSPEHQNHVHLSMY